MNCPYCNSIIPNDSEFCQCCGRDIKKLVVDIQKKGHRRLPIIVLAITTVVGISFGVVMMVFYLNTLSLLNTANDKISEYETEITDYTVLETKYNSLQDDYDALSNDYMDVYEKAMFMDNQIVIVGADGEYYHKYGCPYLDYSEFWAYNTEAAEDDYRACPYCN